jgi:hypothetical protein
LATSHPRHQADIQTGHSPPPLDSFCLVLLFFRHPRFFFFFFFVFFFFDRCLFVSGERAART